jgi:hypothetical protein
VTKIALTIQMPFHAPDAQQLPSDTNQTKKSCGVGQRIKVAQVK